MLEVRKSEARGRTKIDWLNSYHSFSFGSYYDKQHVGFNTLIVINDDYVKAGGGFAEHGHKDMEIVTYVLEGELAHKDSLGNIETIKAGEVQRMSAGTGIRHSEYNYSETDNVRFLQIWFLPKKEKSEPSYEQAHFSQDDKMNNLRLVVSPNGDENSIKIHQDVKIYASILDKGKLVHLESKDRDLWVQVAYGKLEINGTEINKGDGVKLKDINTLDITGIAEKSEFLIFSMGSQ